MIWAVVDVPAPDGVVSTLVDRGVLGVAVVVLGWLAYQLIKREQARADEAQRQVGELNQAIRDDILPATMKAAEAHAAVTALLVKVGELLPDVASALRDYDREHDRGRR